MLEFRALEFLRNEFLIGGGGGGGGGGRKNSWNGYRFLIKLIDASFVMLSLRLIRIELN